MVDGGVGRAARLGAVAAMLLVAGLGAATGEPIPPGSPYVPSGHLLPVANKFSGAVWAGDAYYVLGGTATAAVGVGGDPADQIVRYDPDTGSAVILPQRLPAQVILAQAVWTGTEILVFDGSSCTDVEGSIYSFTPSTGRVARMPTPLPASTRGVAAVWLDGAAYLFGGHGGSCSDLLEVLNPRTLVVRDTVMRYDPGTGALTVLPDRMPFPLSGIGAAEVQGRAILAGGSGPAEEDPDALDGTLATYHRGVLVFDPATGSTTSVLDAGMPYDVHRQAVGDGAHALVLHGASVYRYDPVDNTIAMETTGPRDMRIASAAFDGCRVHAFGGAVAGGEEVGEGLIRPDRDIDRYGPNECPEPDPDTAPVVSIEVGVSLPACRNVPVRLTAHDTPGGERAVAWAWDFGDGQGALGRDVEHRFSDPAAVVVVTGTSSSGAKGSASVVFRLTDEPGCGKPLVPTERGLAPDTDQDGIADWQDNCPSIPNKDQADRDLDGIGDVCQAGAAQVRQDGLATARLGAGLDADGDGVPDLEDVCPAVPDAAQADLDGDRAGDACDDDLDGDGVPQAGAQDVFLDVCPFVPDPAQADRDGDGVGDACAIAHATRREDPPVRAVAQREPVAAHADRSLGILVAGLASLAALGLGARVTARRRRA